MSSFYVFTSELAPKRLVAISRMFVGVRLAHAAAAAHLAVGARRGEGRVDYFSVGGERPLLRLALEAPLNPRGCSRWVPVRAAVVAVPRRATSIYAGAT